MSLEILPAPVRGLLLPAREEPAEAQVGDGLERGEWIACHVEGAVEGDLCSSRSELLHDTYFVKFRGLCSR